MTTGKGDILVVDDSQDNLHLLTEILSAQGYKVRKALNGQMAIQIVYTSAPDLILLDINIPEINGYEVCKRLKTDEKTREIPIIFVSVFSDVLDKVKAFQLGAADFITKPFQAQEVLIRIENQLTIYRQRQQLQQEIEERQRAEDALRVYLHAVSHDLRNPVIGMSMVLKSLLKSQLSSSEFAAETGLVSVPLKILQRMESSCQRQLDLLNSLVETQQFDVWGVPLKCFPLDLFQFTQELFAEWELRFIEHQTTWENFIPVNLPKVSADKNQLWRVFENLIANALKHNSSGLKITFRADVFEKKQENSTEIKKMIRVAVIDNGVGIEQDLAQSLFERYHRGKKRRRTTGLGLGLYLCYQIIKAHGGEIGVITSRGNGAEFWFTLNLSSSISE